MVYFVPWWFNIFSLCPLRLCGKSSLFLGPFFTTEAQRTQRGIFKGRVRDFSYFLKGGFT